VPLAFIIPTACFLKLSQKKWYSPAKLVAIAVMVIGILVMAIGTVLAVIEVIRTYYFPPSLVILTTMTCHKTFNLFFLFYLI